MPESPCGKFTKKDNGVWVANEPYMVPGPSGSVMVGPGMEFTTGLLHMGVDIGAWLDKECG